MQGVGPLINGYVVCQRETAKLFSFFVFLFSWNRSWEDRALQECNLSAQFVRGLQDASSPVLSHCLKPGVFDRAGGTMTVWSNLPENVFRIWPINHFLPLPE